MLVVSYLSFGRLWTQGFPQTVLFVNMPHFFIELAHAKASLNVDDHRAELLAFVNLDRFDKPRLA